MTPEQRRRLNANVCMWLIRNYHHDLCEYYAGDEGRFSRMVTSGGQQLPSASPQGWASHINNLAHECVEYHGDKLRSIFDQLAAWGLKVDHSIFNEGK